MKPNKRATIVTLLERGTPQREIARITGIDRKTVRGYRERWLAEQANSPGVATGSEVAVATADAQTPPPWPPAGVTVESSRSEPHLDFIETQVRLGRNAMAIYQDLVDQHGFAGAYNSVKRFVARLRHKEPERFDRLSFLPGEEMQVDYGEGAPTLVPGTNRSDSRHPAVRGPYLARVCPRPPPVGLPSGTRWLESQLLWTFRGLFQSG